MAWVPAGEDLREQHAATIAASIASLDLGKTSFDKHPVLLTAIDVFVFMGQTRPRRRRRCMWLASCFMSPLSSHLSWPTPEGRTIFPMWLALPMVALQVRATLEP